MSFTNKKSPSTHFFGVLLSTLMDGYCGLRDRPTSHLPPYTYGGPPVGHGHTKKVNTRGDCSAATTTRRTPGNSKGTMSVGVAVHFYVSTHLSNFTHKLLHQMVAQCFYIHYYTQLLHVSAKSPGHFRGVISLVDVNSVHGQLS